MKNFSVVYINHPEAFWIFLLFLLLSIFVLPLFHLYLLRRKKINFDTLKNAYCLSTPKLQDEITTCNFCGSDRSKNELVAEVPLKAKFGFFFIKESGFCRLIQSRCGRCNTRLFCFIEKGE